MAQVLGTMGKRVQVLGKRAQVLGTMGTLARGTTGRMERVRGRRDTAPRGTQSIACRTHSRPGTQLGIRCSMPVGLQRRRSPRGCE